jgi:hypothetical protein
MQIRHKNPAPQAQDSPSLILKPDKGRFKNSRHDFMQIHDVSVDV